MPARAAAARLRGCGALSRSYPYVWISDELLSEALLRFSAFRHPCCKRFNSIVPGPLEASRRLSKRRMNNLCVGSEIVPGTPLDSPPLLGSFSRAVWGFFEPQEPQWTWEPPRAPQPLNTTALALPAWLENLAPTEHSEETPDDANTNQAVHEPSAAQPTTSNIITSVSEYREYLHEVSNIASLRKLRQRCSDLPLDATECSKAEFEHLIQIQASFEDITEYLEDPVLNHAPGANVRRLVENFTTHQAATEQCKVVVDRLHKTLKDAGFAEVDRTATLQMLPTVLLKTHGDESMDPFLEAYRIILDLSATQSSPREISDRILYSKILQHLVDLSQGIHTNLILRLLKTAIPLHFTGHNAVTNTSLAKFAIHLLRSNNTSLPSERWALDPKPLSRVFDELPVSFVQTWIKATMLHLHQLGTGDETATFDFSNISGITEAFLTAIRLCIHFPKDANNDFWRRNYAKAFSIVKPSKVRDHLARLDHPQHALIILRYWLNIFAHLKHKEQHRRTSHYRSLRGLPLMESPPTAADLELLLLQNVSCVRQVSSSVAYPIALIRTMQHCRLPTRGVISYYLDYFLATENYVSFDTLARHTRASLGVKLPRRVLARFLQLRNTSARTALLHLRLNDNIKIEDFPRIQHGLVRDYKTRPGKLINVLLRGNGLGKPQSPARIALIRSAAIDFACVPRFSWGLAYRLVKLCVQYIAQAGVAPDGSLSRALIVAGLVRPLQESGRFRETHLQDVLDMVRSIEGAEVAEKLEKMMYAREEDWLKMYDGDIFFRRLPLR